MSDPEEILIFSISEIIGGGLNPRYPYELMSTLAIPDWKS
jgi:hypothetical protein